MIPSGVSSYVTASGMMQNAPVIITSSGLQETQPSDPFARYDGRGKYKKVGFGNFSIQDNGSPVPNSMEFALQPDCSGYIVFANHLAENVYVEYEGEDSPYYTYTAIDLNPMRNDFSDGFISFSNDTDPVSIHMAATNTLLTANGSQKTNIIATMLDENDDACVGQPIIFSMADAYISYLEPINTGVVKTVNASGLPYVISDTTNGKGQARCQYWPINGQSGAQVVIASWGEDAGIFGYVVINQEYSSGSPFYLNTAASGSYPGTYSTNYPQEYYALPSGVTASTLNSNAQLT
jgi:hypothetical protein